MGNSKDPVEKDTEEMAGFVKYVDFTGKYILQIREEVRILQGDSVRQVTQNLYYQALGRLIDMSKIDAPECMWAVHLYLIRTCAHIVSGMSAFLGQDYTKGWDEMTVAMQYFGPAGELMEALTEKFRRLHGPQLEELKQRLSQ